MDNIRPLIDHVQRIIEFMKLDFSIPDYDQILIGIDHFVRSDDPSFAKFRLKKAELKTIPEFEPTFLDLQKRGFSWINLTVGGLYENAMVFLIELPRESVGVPFGKTSIKLLGPSLKPNGEPTWELARRFDVE